MQSAKQLGKAASGITMTLNPPGGGGGIATSVGTIGAHGGPTITTARKSGTMLMALLMIESC